MFDTTGEVCNTKNMTATRKTTISRRKLCAEGGRAYAETWVGLPVAFTTYEGERLIGTLSHFAPEGGMPYPVATFPNGKHARLDHEIEIVIGEAA